MIEFGTTKLDLAIKIILVLFFGFMFAKSLQQRKNKRDVSFIRTIPKEERRKNNTKNKMEVLKWHY